MLIACHRCKKEFPVEVTDEQMKEFQLPRNERRNVQDIFPTLSADDRELLISQTCPTCWDELWAN